MPSTTNFGWTTPADTDTVTTGAAAIRTLAGGIDTSLVDLKGGLTGQALVKASNTDMDFTWEANGWYVLATSSLTTSTTNLSSLPTTYRDLRIVVNGYIQNSAPTTTYIRFGNGSALSTGYITTRTTHGSTWTANSSATDVLGSGFTATVGSGNDFIVDIPNYAETNLVKSFTSVVQGSGSSSYVLGYNALNSAINYVSFVAGVTPTAGTITVYGRE